VIKQRLADAVAREFDVGWTPETQLNAAEQRIYEEALAEIDSDEWIYQHNRPRTEAPMVEAMFRSRGGLLKSCVILDAQHDRLKQVWLTGDFFIKPRRLIADLEAALRNSRLSELEQNVYKFFARNESELLMLTADDFVQAIAAAIDAVDTAAQ
jgi:lipoate-protein ligase A